jgi:acyl-coenzyme A thioesterase PaaI-like protein
MSQGSQLGGKSTIGAEPHPIIAGFLKDGPGPLTTAGSFAFELKGELLELDLAAGTSLAAFEPDGRFLQGAGVIQGGVVTAMLDYAIAFACFTRLAPGKSFGTVSMTSNFMKPALPARYLASGKLDRAGARMFFASAELRREGSPDLIATASAVLAVTDA